MRLTLVPVAILVCAVTPSCMKVRPEITRRYSTQKLVPVPNGIEAQLAVFAMDVSKESARTTLLNLAERGQASLIKQLGAKAKSSSDLLATLGKPIKAPAKPDGDVDCTVVQRRVILSVENSSTGPADRISTARITLDNLSEGAEFQEWTQFATKYETADLGTLKFTRSREFDLDLAATPAAYGKAEATSKSVNALEENTKLSQRYVSVTGSLSPQKAVLIQQGVPGIDLTGNLAVDLTIQVKPKNPSTADTFSFDSLLDDDGKPNPAAKIGVTRQKSSFVPRPAKDITVSATLIATIRHVVAGDDTVTESDDDVEFRSGPATPVTLTLIPKETLQFSVWLLRDEKGNPLNIDMGDSPEGLQLGSFDDAVALRDYLKTLKDPSQIGNRALSLDGTKLDAAAAKTLKVRIAKLNW